MPDDEAQKSPLQNLFEQADKLRLPRIFAYGMAPAGGLLLAAAGGLIASLSDGRWDGLKLQVSAEMLQISLALIMATLGALLVVLILEGAPQKMGRIARGAHIVLYIIGVGLAFGLPMYAIGRATMIYILVASALRQTGT